MERSNRTLAMRKTKLLSKVCICLCLALTITACSNNEDMIEMQDYAQSVVNRPAGKIEAMPEFVRYETFTYSAASLRGPFDVPVYSSLAMRNQQAKEVIPDETRPKEYLEGFAIENLSMVGVLSKQEVVWALIRDETANISRVTIGNYAGRNHGRIVAITDAQIEMMEIVPTGNGGWVERPQIISIKQ